MIDVPVTYKCHHTGLRYVYASRREQEIEDCARTVCGPCGCAYRLIPANKSSWRVMR